MSASTADALRNESVNDSHDFYQTLLETALPLRQMMAKTSNNLDGDTMDNIDQVNSIPIHMLTLVSMLIDGPGLSNRQFSQLALIIAQIIKTNFRKSKNHDMQQSWKILKKKETPVALYLTLKIYGTFISKTVIDNFFNLVLCLSYDRILKFAKLKITNSPEFFRLTH